MGLAANAQKVHAAKEAKAQASQTVVQEPVKSELPPEKGKEVTAEQVQRTESEPRPTGTDETMVTLKVDGEVIEAPLSEVLELASKSAGADKRFEEAASLRKRYEGWDQFIEMIESNPELASHLDKSIRTYQAGGKVDEGNGAEPPQAADSQIRSLLAEVYQKTQLNDISRKYNLPYEDAEAVMTLAKKQGLIRNTDAAYWMWKGMNGGGSKKEETKSNAQKVLDALKASRGGKPLPSTTPSSAGAPGTQPSGLSKRQENIRRFAQADRPMGLGSKARAWRERLVGR